MLGKEYARLMSRAMASGKGEFLAGWSEDDATRAGPAAARSGQKAVLK
jgi:hypothetical protein